MYGFLISKKGGKCACDAFNRKMKEKLTQQNMLKLLKSHKLSALNDHLNNIEKSEIITYDFKKPKKFTKDQFNSLHSVYENYSRVLGSYISGIIRSLCTVQLISIQEKNYNSIVDQPLFLASANLNFPNENLLPSQMYIELSKDLSFSVIDKMLGGNGDFFEIQRDYTNFELGILDNFVGNIINLMKDPWSNFINIEPVYLRSETNFYLIKGLVASDNTFVEIKMEINFKHAKGTLKLLIPSVTLEGIFKCIYENNSKETKEKNKTIQIENYPELFDVIKDTELKITGVLGKTYISVNDLVSLSIGDLIQLDNDNFEVTLCIDDMPWFKGKYLTKTKYKSIEIHNIIP